MTVLFHESGIPDLISCPMQHLKKPLIVAHRGASGSAPENTMAAFRRAVAAGADMIELDVRLTQDFHIVVHHDRNVRRTTNGKGNVWNLTLSHVRTLDAGSWFSPRFQGEHVPTLREVMEYLLPLHVNLNIEVKTDGDPRRHTHFEECVILIIMEKGFEDRVLVSSFDHTFLKRMHALFPAIKTGALYHPVRDMRKKPSHLCSRIGASAFICSRTQLPETRHQRCSFAQTGGSRLRSQYLEGLRQNGGSRSRCRCHRLARENGTQEGDVDIPRRFTPLIVSPSKLLYIGTQKPYQLLGSHCEPPFPVALLLVSRARYPFGDCSREPTPEQKASR